MRCILCGSATPRLVATIPNAAIAAQYQAKLHIDIPATPGGAIDYFHCGTCDLKFFNPILVGDNEFYARLQAIPWYYADAKIEYDVAAQYIEENDSVLEVGCGKAAFRKYVGKAKYVGLELNQQAKDLAGTAGEAILNIPIQRYAEQFPERHDVVCAFQVLEHVANPNTFVRSMVKCLRTGGSLILAVPSEDSYFAFVQNNILNMPPHHQSRWSDTSLRALGNLFGLDVLTIVTPPVENAHRRLFYSELVKSALFGSSETLIDNSLLYRLKDVFARTLARLIFQHNPKEAYLPRGHTVICALRKS